MWRRVTVIKSRFILLYPKGPKPAQQRGASMSYCAMELGQNLVKKVSSETISESLHSEWVTMGAKFGFLQGIVNATVVRLG